LVSIRGYYACFTELQGIGNIAVLAERFRLSPYAGRLSNAISSLLCSLIGREMRSGEYDIHSYSHLIFALDIESHGDTIIA